MPYHNQQYRERGRGSTLRTTDASGNVVNAYTYDVYGKTTSSSGSQANDVQFAGQQTDATGLQYLRARYYDPGTGTFLSRDPLSAMPGWNGSPFEYAGGNPVVATDPSGYFCIGPLCTDSDGVSVGGHEAVEGAKAIGGAASAVAAAAADYGSGKLKDPLVLLSVAQAGAALSAAVACPLAIASGGAAAPACAAAIALVGYTTWAKEQIIINRYNSGQYGDAEFACRLVTEGPLPFPGVVPLLPIALCEGARLLDRAIGDRSSNGEKQK